MTVDDPENCDQWPDERWDEVFREQKKWDEVEKRLEGFAHGDINAAKGWARAFFGGILVEQRFLAVQAHSARAEDLSDRAYRFPMTARGNRFGHWDEQSDQFGHWDEQIVRQLIEAADAGDEDAHQAVCHIIAWHVAPHWGPSPAPLPLFLRSFLHKLLQGIRVKPARGRGWDTVANYLRDEFILKAVDKLMKQGGFSRTRNPATDKASACSIVAEVLTELGNPISEKTVGKIRKGGKTDEPFSS